MNSPKLRRHAPRRRGGRTRAETSRGSKQPRRRRRPRLLPPPVAARLRGSESLLPRIHSPERRNKKLWATGRHAPQPLPFNLHSSSRRHFRPSPCPAPTTTRGTATTTHAAHSETASPGGADGEAEEALITPVVEKVWSHSHRRACEVGEGWSVTGQPAKETGMGGGVEGGKEREKRTRLGHVLKRRPWDAPAAPWRQRRRRMGSVRPIGAGKYLRGQTWEGTLFALPLARAYSGTDGRSSCLDALSTGWPGPVGSAATVVSIRHDATES